MVEPVDLETWMQQEEGFAWIPAARRSTDLTERRRAQRAQDALLNSLGRILAQGSGQGWIQHRHVGYLLLVVREGETLCLLTLARRMSWPDSQ
jgi:hypothetical protein